MVLESESGYLIRAFVPRVIDGRTIGISLHDGRGEPSIGSQTLGFGKRGFLSGRLLTHLSPEHLAQYSADPHAVVQNHALLFGLYPPEGSLSPPGISSSRQRGTSGYDLRACVLNFDDPSIWVFFST